MASHSNRSIFREGLILAIPSFAVFGATLAAGGLSGSLYWIDCLAAVLLVVPVTITSHALTLRWAKRRRAGAFLGMILGTALRVLCIVGGGLILYLSTDRFRSNGIALWIFLIGIYLTTLVVEIWLHTAALSANRS